MNESLGSLGELVANLQSQIDSLAAQLRQNSSGNSPVGAASLSSAETLVRSRASGLVPSVACDAFSGIQKVNGAPSLMRPESNTASSLPRSEFYGPTSPDYSLNMAQIKLWQRSCSKTAPEKPIPAIIDEDETDDEGAGNDGWQEDAGLAQLRTKDQTQRLLHFRSLFNVREAVRLLLVYQEVVGEYHPILDIDMLVKQVEWWYSWHTTQPPSGLSAEDENTLLVTNLAIMVALCAESTSPGSGSSEMGETIYACCQDLINAKLASPTPSLKHVVIMLLVGILHFFKDIQRFAWRMCGLAGRTMMELGLHNRDVARHVLSSEKQWSEYAAITASIVILDRQWSAATGLPTHFANSDFDQEHRSSLKNPYLKAMTSFILISDKFSEPCAQVANGGAYDDDEEFDIMNFQIEQWRKKAVGSYGLPQSLAGQAPSSFPPAWAILLNLRGNAQVEGISNQVST
ncbi:Zn(2)-C6 fungal-type DNA-binding domain protein [Pleurostoma richardsiae]|uniref:Zn(2)-C6 fungal-type DNA-binding domain protein n=1 Tax=Pleurostoma richardsiae TaxID=41990 RepID=A0AA38RHE6_9PEZI|nr:Zn(2)-C6 fungal-type DNA-binding domain protein [Pleurostoma richardsiae]